jgi:pyruvate dehydrogenase E1 component alpha subunit
MTPDDAQARDALLAHYRLMARIRRAELSLAELFAAGAIPGFIHLSVGQEAMAAGVVAQLRRDDTLVTTHRGHGHAIAKGCDLDRFFLEIFGRDGGLCRGRGGSMHIADMAAGMLGANGIVGAGIPIAVGSALAQRRRGTGAVAAAMFGDGALAEGALHEGMNLARAWALPVLLVCENNGWSEFSPAGALFRGTLEGLAAAFGLGYRRVDGDDVEAVAAAAAAALAELRAGGPAQVLEGITHRHRGHFEGDPQRYRDPAELARLATADPLRRCARRLDGLGVGPAALAAIEAEEAAVVAAAIARARAAPLPAFADALAGVYAAGGRG